MNGNGDCYQVAGRFALNGGFGDQARVCHGDVVGQGKIAGIVHGHAWIEIDDLVIDKSNGNDIVIQKEVYYMIGKIKNVKRYTFKEARKWMLKTGHFGSWE